MLLVLGNRERLLGPIDSLAPGGGTGLHDTALGAMDAAAEPGSINAVVPLDHLITRVEETRSDEPVARMAVATDGVAYEVRRQGAHPRR
ncbi:hypothetical protein [Herbidospora cretacea]|uniref:hypothetical protein n=1 Tax=Herbidospora cretacea TaxID=28444 RepID=UPI0006913BFB|nr:hypothetical protein [Herbidospora cretacea]